MKPVTIIALVCVTILLGLLSACSSSPLTNLSGAWTDPKFKGMPLSKILVVGMAKKESSRSKFEQTLKKEIMARGGDAIASLDVMPAEEKIERAAFEKYFRDKNVDGVIVARLTGVTTTQEAIADETTPQVTEDLTGSFQVYYETAYGGTYTPPVIRETNEYSLEIRLFETKEGTLMWKGASRTVNPDGVSDLIDAVSTSIADSLVKAGMLKKKP